MRTGSKTRLCRSRGFTLLEVLAALVVFALAATILAGSYLNVLNAYYVAAQGMKVNEDFAFARQLITTQPEREKVEQGGQFDTAAGRSVRWSAEIASTTTADLFNVTFTCEVTESSSADPVKHVEQFLLLRPTWSTDPAEQSQLKEEAKQRILELQVQK